jgi:ribosomal protein L14E/L6E/L27E
VSKFGESDFRRCLGWKCCIDLRFFVQVLVDGPSTEEQKIVPRHVLPLAHATLTHFTIPQLPRAAGTGPVKKLWAKNEIDGKWAKSSFAQRSERSERRKNLSDFERFKVLRLRKQVRRNIGRGIRSGIMRLGPPDRIIWGITNSSTNTFNSRLATRSRSPTPRLALPTSHK